MTTYAWTPWVTNAPDTTAYWNTQSFDAGTTRTEQPSNTLKCWDVTFRYKRTTPTGTREDYATFGLRIGKQISGFQVGEGLLSELPTIEGFLNTLASSIATLQSNAWTLDQYIWHDRSADHPAAKGGSEKPGPAIRYTTKSVVGSQASMRMPDQVSVTVTFKTCSRRHWGRVYIPGIASGNFDVTFGRVAAAASDGLALGFRTLANSLDAAGYNLVVWSYPKKAALGITQIACDDIPDIIRRRRAKQRNYVKTYTS